MTTLSAIIGQESRGSSGGDGYVGRLHEDHPSGNPRGVSAPADRGA